MTFLEKYELLKKSVPVPALALGPFTVETVYANFVYRSKNCYFCFDGFKLEDSMYTTMGVWGNKLVDCEAVTESEKCYKCIDSNKCHSCTYLVESNECSDSHYCAFLNSCTNCFGCVALTHKKYCIFNKQYTKVEYFKKVEVLNKEKPEKILEQMFDLKQKLPHPASQQFNSENSPYGNYIYNSKNSYWCFNSYYCENSGYNFAAVATKNCWDVVFAGGDQALKKVSERCYQLMDSINCYDCAYLQNSSESTNCYYGEMLRNCSDCFGCVALTNKKYCILNIQLTKNQYEKAIKDIKKELGWN